MSHISAICSGRSDNLRKAISSRPQKLMSVKCVPYISVSKCCCDITFAILLCQGHNARLMPTTKNPLPGSKVKKWRLYFGILQCKFLVGVTSWICHFVAHPIRLAIECVCGLAEVTILNKFTIKMKKKVYEQFLIKTNLYNSLYKLLYYAYHFKNNKTKRIVYY